MQRKYIDLIIMLVLAAFGIAILSLTTSTFKKIPSTCNAKLLRASLRTIMGIGAVLVALGFGYLICAVRCDCYGEGTPEPLFSQAAMLYFFAFLILSVIMLVFSVIINIELKKCNISSKSDVKQNFIIISVISGLYVGAAIVFGGLSWWRGRMSDGGAKGIEEVVL